MPADKAANGRRLISRRKAFAARSVHGVDPATVVLFKVEKQGDEYWATRGRKHV